MAVQSVSHSVPVQVTPPKPAAQTTHVSDKSAQTSNTPSSSSSGSTGKTVNKTA
jgi:hypothetical protein